MNEIEKSPDIATLNAQVVGHLPREVADRIAALPQDDLETLSQAYIALVALDGEAPEGLVDEIEFRLRATEVPGPTEDSVPNVVTY